MDITLRKSIATDLEIFFRNQTDEEANYMAAFTPKNPHDKAAYMEKWQRLMHDDSINMQTIIFANEPTGCVVKFMMEGEAEITYAIAKAHWGKGIATLALRQFLEIEPTRPINGRVAFDNFGSQKILEKNGFEKIGTARFFANARGKEIEEFIYRLNA